jgi:hypothetical protein
MISSSSTFGDHGFTFLKANICKFSCPSTINVYALFIGLTFRPHPTPVRLSSTHTPTIQSKSIGRRTLGRRLDTQKAKPDEIRRKSVSLVRGENIPVGRDKSKGISNIVIAAPRHNDQCSIGCHSRHSP